MELWWNYDGISNLPTGACDGMSIHRKSVCVLPRWPWRGKSLWSTLKIIYKCQLYLSYFPIIFIYSYLSSINASNYRKYHHSSSINDGISQYLCRTTIRSPCRSPCPASRKDSSNSSALSMRPASIGTIRTVGFLKPIELYLL